MSKAKNKDERATQANDELLMLRRKVMLLEDLEHEREQAMEAFIELERRFRSVFENVSTGILMTGSDSRVLMANPPALRFLGLGENAVGNRLTSLVPQAAGLLTRANLGNRQRVEIVTADGEKRLIGFTNQPLTLPEGKGLLTLFNDISQISREEERRRRAEQLAYVGEMAARLSHEIKNPLSTVQTGLKLLTRQAELDSDSNDVLETVVKEVGNIITLVSTLLDSARIDRFQPEILDLVSVLHDTCDIFHSMAKGKGRGFRLDFPTEEIKVILDKKAFGRALGNLIHNSMDAVSRGGSITVDCREISRQEIDKLFPGFEGGVACIRVTDDGPGIPPEIRKMIFKPFFTTKESGTGLGLAVAHEIIDYHGGVISLADNTDKGSAFNVYLPVGERAPCWEWVVYHEWEIYYGEDRCEQCEVKQSGTGQFCWNEKMRADQIGGELFPEKCINCRVALAGNLARHFRPGG